MDAISYSYADKAQKRIKRIIENPDSTSGILTVPKVIASGETITIPAGRVAILPNVQVDGTLNVQGDVFIPSGATLSGVVEKVTSTDNAIVRFDGTTGKVQNSGVIIDGNNNVGIGTSSPAYILDARVDTGSSALHLQTNGLGGCDVLVQATRSGPAVIGVGSSNGSLAFATGTDSGATATERMRINANGNLLVGTTTDDGANKLQVKGSISALPPSFGIQQQVNNHRKLYCFYTENVNKNRLKLTISGNTTYISFVLNIVYSNLYSGSDQSAIRVYSFKRVAIANTTNFSEIGTGLGSTVTVISSNVVTGGYEVVLGFNTGGFPQFDIEIVNHQLFSIGTITGEFLTV